ncbi:MAG: nuclear transport factor 2 family protein [Chloroflexi bacterium]|nr:nuclear transport factor 2 family protein [Chloroflexota bacterium]
MRRNRSRHWMVAAVGGLALVASLFLAARAMRQALAQSPAWTKAVASPTVGRQATPEDRRDGAGSADSESSPEAIVQRAVAALQQRQLPSHLADVADDIVFELNGDGPYNGKDGYGGALRAVYWAWESLQSYQIADVVATDQALVDVSVSEERELRTQRPAGGQPEEREADRRGLVTTLYTVRDGKIVGVKLRTLNDRVKFIPTSGGKTWDIPFFGRVSVFKLE